jgi:glycosyltransferase involved in cell wall biosynthesis
MQLEENQYVYCWSNWKECEKLSNNFVIVNPMFSNRSYESVFKKEVHDYALIEGAPFKDTVPDWMPHQIFRYTTKDFCDITNEQREKSKKVYDWIMVSSFDPRKRHVEFIIEMIGNSNAKNLKGCVVGRNPDNKGYKNPGHTVLQNIKKLSKVNNLDIDIFLNVSQDTKKDLMSMSRVFVCASALDNGPRAMVEAAQAGLPLISMSHIGSSDLIHPGVTGEIVNNFKDFPTVLINVLNNYKKYDKHKNAISLLPENVFPNLIKKIKERKNDQCK